MRPFQVLEMQADLAQRLKEKPDFREYVETAFTTHLEDVLNEHDPIRIKHVADQTLRAFVRAVFNGEAFHVTDEMCLLVDAAASQLNEEDRIDSELAPTPMGIMRLDRPYISMDARAVPMKVHWITWNTLAMADDDGHNTVPGLVISMWNDGDDPDVVTAEIKDDCTPEQWEWWQQVVGRWHFVGQISMVTGDTVGQQTVPIEKMSYTIFSRIVEAGLEPQPTSNFSRWVHALFLLMRQTVVRVNRHEPNSKERRRLKRMPIPGNVTVIELRRSEYPEREHGESHVEWSHRWLVRGHWRWQACGPGRKERKRTWVTGHIKGPEDKPLVVSTRIYDLRR